MRFIITTEIFKEKAISIHGSRYDYSESVYTKDADKIKILCKKHGAFYQTYNNHIRLHYGCQKCGRDITAAKKIDGCRKKFVASAIAVHGNTYDYSLVEYTKWNQPVKIICSSHGVFLNSPNNHISNKTGCPKCVKSRGEMAVEAFLKSLNIDYTTQKRFDRCKNKRTLPFDFFIPSKNLLIEYDGRQHFEPVPVFGGEVGFKKTLKNDSIKNKYCLDNNIILVRIRYDENIVDSLTNYI